MGIKKQKQNQKKKNTHMTVCIKINIQNYVKTFNRI